MQKKTKNKTIQFTYFTLADDSVETTRRDFYPRRHVHTREIKDNNNNY